MRTPGVRRRRNQNFGTSLEGAGWISLNCTACSEACLEVWRGVNLASESSAPVVSATIFTYQVLIVPSSVSRVSIHGRSRGTPVELVAFRSLERRSRGLTGTHPTTLTPTLTLTLTNSTFTFTFTSSPTRARTSGAPNYATLEVQH